MMTQQAHLDRPTSARAGRWLRTLTMASAVAAVAVLHVTMALAEPAMIRSRLARPHHTTQRESAAVATAMPHGTNRAVARRAAAHKPGASHASKTARARSQRRAADPEPRTPPVLRASASATPQPASSTATQPHELSSADFLRAAGADAPADTHAAVAERAPMPEHHVTPAPQRVTTHASHTPMAVPHTRRERRALAAQRAAEARAERAAAISAARRATHESAAERGVAHRSNAAAESALASAARATPAPTAVFASGQAHPDEDVSVATRSAHRVAATAASADVVAIDNDPSLAQLHPLDATAATMPAEMPENDDRLNAITHPTRETMAEAAAAPMMLPGLYRNGRLVVPPPMKGSREILAHQNEMADSEGLERIRNEEQLNALRASHDLVNLPESVALHLNPELGSDRRCARPWTVRFATVLARDYYAHFHQPLQVNSAVRTISYQLRLQRTNGNAAGIGGELASPHLTGQAIDIGKHGMSVEQIAWMRTYLKPLMQAGLIDVEEEFQQACFHISVYKAYAPTTRRPARELAHADLPSAR